MGGGVGAGVWGREAEGRVGGHLDGEDNAGPFSSVNVVVVGNVVKVR